MFNNHRDFHDYTCAAVCSIHGLESLQWVLKEALGRILTGPTRNVTITGKIIHRGQKKKSDVVVPFQILIIMKTVFDYHDLKINHLLKSSSGQIYACMH